MPQNHIKVYLFNRQDLQAGIYGVGTYIEELSKGISLLTNVDLFIVNFGSKTYNDFKIIQIRNNISCIYIPSFENQINISSEKKLIDNLEDQIVELTRSHISNDENNIFLFNCFLEVELAEKIKKKFKGKIIYVVHCFMWYFDFKGNKKKFIEWEKNNFDKEDTPYNKERKFYKIADHIICVTRHAKRELIFENNIPKQKITTIHNGLQINENVINENDKNNILTKIGFLNSDKIILYVGRISELKGIFELLKAFRIVLQENPDVHLVLIGNGNIDFSLRYCTGIWKNVHFTGFLPKEQVYEFYKIAKVGVIPSYFEWCSYVAIEMMAMKLPILTSNAGGLNEIFEHNKSSLKIKNLITEDGQIYIDEKKLAKNISLLINSDSNAQLLKDEAYRVYKEKFTNQIMINKTMNLLFNQFN